MGALLPLLAAAAGVFLLAALAQAITGFGSALVAVPLLSLVTDPVTAVVAATGVSLVLTGGVAWREREDVDVPVARLLVLSGVVGLPVGLLLLETVDESRLEAGIAAVLLLMVVLMASGLRVGARATPVAGLASGALLTSTGMNGPPLVMALVGHEPRRYRATLQSVFALQDLVAMAAFLALGHGDREVALLTAGGIVGLPLGWRLGERVFHRVPAEWLRPLVITGLMVVAVSMLGGALS